MRPSFSEHPLLRVSRPVSACSRCRSAKIKCDGKLPACTACEKAGREPECSSANDQFARGKERSYVAALELRIEKLSRRLTFAKSRMASVSHHESEPAPLLPPPDRKDSLALIKAAIHRKAAKTRENLDVTSLVSDFGFLSVNATTRDFEPSAINMTFARLVLAATINESLPQSPDPLPSRQAAVETVQYYMQHVYPLLPAFSESSLFGILNGVYDNDRLVTDWDRWMLLLVLAIGSSAQSKKADDAFYAAGVEYIAHALAFADRALAPGYPSQIQCLLLLTQYAMLDPAHFDSWLLIGFASRAAVDLGFHQDPPSKTVPDKAMLDMRRRIFYCVYALDRAISMVHARPFSFSDAAVNVAFPALSTSPTSPLALNAGAQSSEPALLHFQLRRAQSHWYQDLCQSPLEAMHDPQSYIWRMCHDMREWNDHLPKSLAPVMRELFDLELRYSYVYCIGARAQLLTDYGRLLIFEHAIAYLDAMHAIAHNPSNASFYTYHDALKVYFMASQLVAVLRDAEDLLLSGQPVPMPLAPPAGHHHPGAIFAPPPVPPRRTRPGETNLTRSLCCLEGVPQILTRWGERWVDALQLGESFELVFGEVMERLRARKTVQDTMQQQQQQQQRAPSPQPSPHRVTHTPPHPLTQTPPHQLRQQQASPHQLSPQGGGGSQPPRLRHVNSAGPPPLRHATSGGDGPSPIPLRHQNSMGSHPSQPQQQQQHHQQHVQLQSPYQPAPPLDPHHHPLSLRPVVAQMPQTSSPLSPQHYASPIQGGQMMSQQQQHQQQLSSPLSAVNGGGAPQWVDMAQVLGQQQQQQQGPFQQLASQGQQQQGQGQHAYVKSELEH
jgi:hypothetical protein